MLKASTTLLLKRGYATTAAGFTEHSLKNGIKIAASSGSNSTGAISVVIAAGSRQQQSAGVATVVKHALFKATNKRSAIRLVRETEMMGATISSALAREHLVLTAEFMKGDEGFFAEALGDAITQAKFAPHEYNEEVLPNVASEYETAIRSPAHYALDLAHTLAFRHGLGNSLFADPHTPVDHLEAIKFAQTSFGTPGRIAVASTGVEGNVLSSLVEEFFSASASPSAPTATPAAAASSYYGGDIRVPSVLHTTSPSDHFLLAFKGASSAAAADLTVLRYLLGGESSIKWSKGSSPFSLLSTSPHVSAQAFNLTYSDAGLFGVMLKAPTMHMAGLAEKVISELKRVAKGSATAESVQQAIAKAKFAAATEVESKVAHLENVGAQLLTTGSVKSIETILAEFDKVTVDSLTKAAGAALASRATTVAIGDVHRLPYADSLGL